MRIHWGLAFAVGATFAWVNLAQAVGPKIDRPEYDTGTERSNRRRLR